MNGGGIGRWALAAAAALLLVALGYRLAPRGPAPASGAAEGADDASGWRSAGETAFAAGRFPDAVAAYRRAVALAPGDANSWSALGEALVQVEHSVGAPAIDAFHRTLRLDPTDARARYFLAVRRDLDGDHRGALADWQALLRDAPPDAPWAGSVRDLIRQVAAREHIAVALPPAPAAAPTAATAAIPGPDAAQLQDAARLTPTEQNAMARAMTERLAARLAANPHDADGWMRLIRARTVLGDQAGARAALASGRAAFSGDAATQAQLEAAARAVGL